MKQLNYDLLNRQGFDGYLLPGAPEKILQFGEGNFLRGFVDSFVDQLNEKNDFNGKVLVVQPIAQGMGELLNEQQGLYTLFLRGKENGRKVNKKRLISSISRCINPYTHYADYLAAAANPDLRFIVSNTTEAGIAFDESGRLEDAPAAAFPGKLTQFLYRRYTVFNGSPDKGVYMLACELNDDNGNMLRKCVLQYAELWRLPSAFVEWLTQCNWFCNTLVDRIITGYPHAEAGAIGEELGYEDKLLDTGEPFGLWMIEAPKALEEELCLAGSGLPIQITDDLSPFKMRKVRILNGAHTSTVLAAYLMGYDIVRDCMEDETVARFMQGLLHDEVIPCIPLPVDELTKFAGDVKERFENPFIDHQILSIALNSLSKWRARIQPSLLDYYRQKHGLPPRITFSFAALAAFYSSGGSMDDGVLQGVRNGAAYPIQDDAPVMDFFAAHATESPEELIGALVARKDFWGEELAALPGFVEQAAQNLAHIRQMGMRAAMEALLKQ